MPLFDTNLDPGFTAPPALPTAPTQPQQDNSLLDFVGGLGHVSALLNPGTFGPTVAQDLPTIQAAFRQDNAVVNAVQYFTKPQFPADPNFDPKDQLQKDGLWDTYRDNFVDVRSQQEYDYKVAQIAQENKDRQTMSAAGPAGLVYGLGAGLLDPTTFLPFIGEGKGALAILKTALLAGTAASIDEVPLRANQETRTNADSAFSIGGATVFGAILGGGVVFLRGRTQADALEHLIGRIDDPHGGTTIPTSQIKDIEESIAATKARHAQEITQVKPELDGVPISERHATELSTLEDELARAKEEEATSLKIDQALRESSGHAASVGAEAVVKDAGSLKGMLGIGEALRTIAGPVTANLGQRISKEIRQITAQLSTAGLRLEKNVLLDSKGQVIGGIPSNEGGTVESIINMRKAESMQVLQRTHQHYADYVFGQNKGPQLLRNTRASMASLTTRRAKVGPNERLNKPDFMNAVGDAILAGGEHAIPEVAAAAKDHMAYMEQLFKEAQGPDVNLIPEDVKLLGDTSFLNRVYDTYQIARNENRFVDILKNHFTQALQADFAKIAEAYQNAQARDAGRLHDMTLPLDQATQLRTQFQAELKALDAADDDNVGPIEQLITGYRSEAAARAKKANELTRKLDSLPRPEQKAAKAQIEQLQAERDKFRQEVKDLQEMGGADLEQRATRRAELKHRLRNLNRNQYFVQEKYRKKFSTIEDLEQSNIDSMHRTVGAGQRALKELDHISDKSEGAIAQASSALDSVVQKWVNLGNKIEALKAKPENADLSLENPDLEVAKLLDYQGKQDETLQRLLDAQEHLRSIQNIDRTEGGVADARAAVQEALDATVEKLTKLNDKRAVRAAKLEKDAAKFDEKAWATRKADIEARMESRREKTHDKLNDMGADNIDLVKRTANFDERAKEIAQMATDKIMGTNVRLAGFDAIQGERGTELARSLSVPSEQLRPYGFLVRDAERLLETYANTLIPDIEITRRLGPFAPDGNLNLGFKRINEEAFAVKQAAEDNFRAEAAKAGKPVDEKKLGDLLGQIDKEFKVGRENIDAILRRLRHQWGVPQNPNGYLARGVRIVNNLQLLRLLGTVFVSSWQDVARPVMKYGLNRTITKAWIPFFTSLKTARMSVEEAQRYYIAIETMRADRAHSLAYLMEGAQARTRPERALEWGTSKIGLVAGFAPWTDMGKTISNMAFISKVMDSLEIVTTRRAKGLKEATEFLNSLGWSDAMKDRIWKQMQNGGAEKRGGTWIPQTENWTDKDAVRSFRAAANAEASASIITPGVELPKFANSNAGWKIITALKSFALASTSKTLMAALQQRDMAVLNGIWMSMALGYLSYWAKAQIAGGSTLDKANSLTPNQAIATALDQSGILGAVGIAAQFLSDASAGPASGEGPIAGALKGARHFLGATEINSPADSLLEDVGGPAVSLAKLVAQAAESGKWSPAEIHRIRQLLPLQNLVYLRWLFDKLENTVGGDR